MSTRIESGKPIQLILEEPSTVIVISKSTREPDQPIPREIPSERWRVNRFIHSSIIREATQEVINFGEDSEGHDGDIKLTAAMIKAREKNISYEECEKFLIQDLHRMENQIGPDPRLDEARDRFFDKAREIWTAKEEELNEILNALQIPSPRIR